VPPQGFVHITTDPPATKFVPVTVNAMLPLSTPTEVRFTELEEMLVIAGLTT
jgi:hypothetical protein